MTLEVKPVGVTCNLRCTYCYEEPMRDVQAVHKYNRVAVLKQLETATGSWSLFGGEALMLPLPELEELLKLGFDRWGKTGIQTNATLITETHIELFDKYRTSVGISMDGCDDLNDSRWNNTLAQTRKATARSEWALYRLLELSKEPGKGHLRPSLIVTLQATNAAVDRWPRMKDWLRKLDDMGLGFINFHLMEMDSKASELYLPHERLKEVMLDLWEFSTTLKNLKFSTFKEITDILRGRDQDVMCVWHACDPWNTAAVQGIEGDGSPSKCGRANKDGIDWLPGEGGGTATIHQIGGFKGSTLHDRQLSLYVTPQEHGGCKDCRFWMMCKGQCPGTAYETPGKPLGDWRTRSNHCQTFIDMFTEGERRIVASGEIPLSLSPSRIEIEKMMYDAWTAGEIHVEVSSTIQKLKDRRAGKPTGDGSWKDGHGDGHGDHLDASNLGEESPILRQLPPGHGDHFDTERGKPSGASPGNKPHSDTHGDAPHGDHLDTASSPESHGDQHGDHVDAANPSSIPPPELVSAHRRSDKYYESPELIKTRNSNKHGDHYDGPAKEIS